MRKIIKFFGFLLQIFVLRLLEFFHHFVFGLVNLLSLLFNLGEGLVLSLLDSILALLNLFLAKFGGFFWLCFAFEIGILSFGLRFTQIIHSLCV